VYQPDVETIGMLLYVGMGPGERLYEREREGLVVE
jgi:hypothetical protein